MLEQLKVKIVNLADEAKYIRKLEKKEKRNLDMLSIRARLAAGDLTQKQITRLARKCMTVVTKHRDLRNIGFENLSVAIDDTGEHPVINVDYRLRNDLSAPDASWIQKSADIWNSLRLHRVGVVRSEARSAHIAYGFLRGHTYAQTESFPYEKRWVGPTSGVNLPDWRRINVLVAGFWRYTNRFASEEEAMEAFAAWRPWTDFEKLRGY